jgi:hypothetical protein
MPSRASVFKISISRVPCTRSLEPALDSGMDRGVIASPIDKLEVTPLLQIVKRGNWIARLAANPPRHSPKADYSRNVV